MDSNGGSSRRVTKLNNSLNGEVSPLILTSPTGFSRRYCNLRSPRTPILDPYASSGSSYSPNPDTTLNRFRIFRGSREGPLTSLENFDLPAGSLLLFKSPVSIEEDVIVMDGIPVDSGNTTEGRQSPSASPGLSGKENSRDLPEKSGHSTTGQGKEGLRPRISYAKKTNESCKYYIAGYCIYGSNCRYLHDPVNNDPQTSIEGPSAPEIAPALPAIPPPPVGATSSSAASAIKQGEKAKDCSSSLTGITSEFADWCPLDNGITATWNGKALSRQEFMDHIEAVLYGPSLRSRLPAFSEFCPEP